MADLRQENPRFTDRYIQERLWDPCIQLAVDETEKEMNQVISEPPALSWHDVFQTVYSLEG